MGVEHNGREITNGYPLAPVLVLVGWLAIVIVYSLVTDGSSASASSVYGPTIIAVGIFGVLIANWPHVGD